MTNFIVTLGFMIVSVFDILHTLSYDGMPFTVAEHLQTSVWFWVLARITDTLLILFGLVYFNRDKVKQGIHYAKYYVIFSLIVTVAISYLVITYSDRFPLLIVEGEGTTALKNSIEYVSAGIHLIGLIYFWRTYKKTKQTYHADLLLACYFLILCALTVTLYTSIHSFSVIVAHVFKVLGYFYIMKSFYYQNLKVPLEEKQVTEKKLVDVSSELESLFKYTPDAIVIFDRESRLIFRSNVAFKEMFGFDQERPVFLEQIVPQTNDEITSYVEELHPSRSLINFPTQLKRKNEQLIEVSVTISPIKLENQQVVYAAIIRDETDKKKVEKEMKKARQELQETIEHHQGTIFKVKKIEGEYRFTLCDGKLLRKYCDTPEDIIGRTARDFFPPEIASVMEEHYEQAWKGEPLTYQSNIFDGIILLISLIPKKYNGQTVEIFGTITDITTLIETEELLRKTEKLTVVGELAAGFAHEIRNPLTTLKGFIQLLEITSEIKNKEYLTIMHQEIDRLEMITNEFMVVAKPQAIKYQRENINNIITEVLQFMGPQALLMNVEMKKEGTESKALIYCDKNQLRQVFINLIKNAMEAMPNGGTIIVKVATDDMFMEISVMDEGNGIPEEIIGRLGEPFYTLKEKGTGLGLMVTKKIIESHNGFLEIKSQVGAGTTMTIKLPLWKEETSKTEMKAFS